MPKSQRDLNSSHLPLRHWSNFSTFTTTHRRERKRNRVHGIKLPLYKNTSFFPSVYFFLSFFPILFFKLEHFTVDATKKAVIVSQAQLFLITPRFDFLKHTTAKQHVHLEGFKVSTTFFSYFLVFFFLTSCKLLKSWFSFEFRAAAILLVDLDFYSQGGSEKTK